MALDQDAFKVSVQTSRGRTYVLEFTDDLSQPDGRLVEIREGDGGIGMFQDVQPGGQQRFYRVREQ